MNLFTVTIDFEDRTRAVMQVEAENEISALKQSIRTSEAISGYDRKVIESTLENFLRVIQVAMGYKGVWLWHHINFDCKSVADIYGGTIIQTDKSGPLREVSN